MELSSIFTTEELEAATQALSRYRTPGAFEPGRWMVSGVNREEAKRLGAPETVRIRDISLRTMEQIPGVINSLDERRELLRALCSAGVPSVVTSCFRRGHSAQEMRADVETARAMSPDCELVYGNAVRAEDMELAGQAGFDAVQVWSSPFLGEAMPVSAGAVYHRAWQGRDWRDLRLPKDVGQHIARSCRLIGEGRNAGIQVSATINMLAYASDEYVEAYCSATADAGAYEIVLADSSGGVGPEAWARLVRIAKAAAPGCAIGVHAHNAFGVGVAASIAGAVAGAEVLELAVNGLEMGAGGSQANLCATALALEALYGVKTGLDLSKMTSLAEMVAQMSGYPIPWNEPGVGSSLFTVAPADEYEQEYQFDPLIHAAITPELVGATRQLHVGSTTGPFGMWEKLRQLGIKIDRTAVEPIMAACKAEIRAQRRPLDDDDIRRIATKVIADLPQSVSR